MKNVKFIAGFSIFGFLLSILSSFGSHRSFGMKFILAVVFAAVFGACAFLISYLYKNFLEGDSSGFADGGSISPAVASAQPSSGSGHSVDITVQDEDLPSEENENQFFVGSKRQMLNDEDMNSLSGQKNSQNQASVEQIKNENQSSSEPGNFTPASIVSNQNGTSSNAGFVPVSLAENADNFSSIEAKSDKEVETDKKVAQMNSMPVIDSSGDADNLDVLPDLEDISSGPVSSPTRDEGVVEETDFSEGKNISSGSGPSAEEVTQGKDAELMAKAISTLLAKE